MKQIVLIFSLFFGLGFLAGCGNASDQTYSASAPTYRVRIATAPSQTEELSFNAPSEELGLAELLSYGNVNITLAKRDEIVVSSVNGVLNTASKSWQVYLNGQPRTYQELETVIIRPSDRLEFIYSEIK